ncbi:hypothetical protein PHJA_002420300 [Phtheirospermum japonicum]|uniref:Uncharacterized protein n=1 Tax=Phtheirospermum japonicum TaxID=374723 RepID=A0A830D3F7_9LAMI|nr:hypothetical protein PHJA_002420300 [Phtheirospermum japonicum]
MDNSNNMSYQAGQAKGQAQEKGNQLMDKASNVAQSAKESMQQVIFRLDYDKIYRGKKNQLSFKILVHIYENK